MSLAATAPSARAHAGGAGQHIWPDVAHALRLNAARSIGEGNYVGSGMVALGLLAALVLMRRKPAAAAAITKVVP